MSDARPAWRSGQAVVTGEGLAGRIAEVGDNSARVLFVTDVNSRLPVLIERTRERAILAGDNSTLLRLTLVQSRAGRAARRSDRDLGPRRQLPGRHPGRRGRADGRRDQREVRPFADFSRLEFVSVVDYGVTGLVGSGGPPAASPAGAAGPRRVAEMRADGLLAMLDRWGRLLLPGVVLLFFVLLTLAPLRAPYISDTLPLLPALVVFQFSLATPERLPGPLLLAMGVLLDLLLGGPGAPVGVSALGFVLIRAAVVNNRRYLVGVPFLFQWFGFCLLALGFVVLVWVFTALWTWTAIDAVPGA